MAHEKEPVGVLLELERESAATLHERLESRLREYVRSGRLPAGTRLPSSRALAGALGISRGVVVEAYSQLVAEGYLTARQGAPTRVAPTPAAERPPVPASALQPRYVYDFDPELPDLADFPRDRWLRSERAALREAPYAALGHQDARGTIELRDQLMSYLGRVRGAAPEPEHTLICSGAVQGLALICRTLSDRGLERIAVEEPGWRRHRLIAQRNGLEPRPIAVDEHGVNVEALHESGCEAVIVTPAHQFPTGVVLSSERRAALLQWAEEVDALIVEDDHDAELRYDRDPLGALQGLAPERVCHLGSATALLAPGLRLGWILSPSWLTGALSYEKGLADAGSPVIAQLAQADLMARGELDRHLRRMRLRYRERRRALVEALEDFLPQVELSGVAAGLYALALLPPGVEEGAVLSAAAARRVGVEGLQGHSLSSPPSARAGLVLGFASLPEPAIRRGIELLAEAVEAG